MDIIELKKWAIENNIEQRTINGFWKNLQNYKENDLKEFLETFGDVDKNDLYLKINIISLNLGNWPECSHSTVSANIPIMLRGKTLGYYRLFFTLNGEVEDDCFVIY